MKMMYTNASPSINKTNVIMSAGKSGNGREAHKKKEKKTKIERKKKWRKSNNDIQ